MYVFRDSLVLLARRGIMPAMSQSPKVKAFLICDQVIRSTDGKYTIVGVFRRVHAPQFPVFHARFGLYLMLGELNGKYDFTIQFMDPSDGQTLGRADLKGVEYRTPLDDFETGLNLPGLQFPRAGVFEVHLLCNGELLHVDTLTAVQMDNPGPKPPAPPAS
ncbi:hypothetical protein PLCT2_01126 [Planctomycetaceae bacterium]|nr:hypothetical protein PLCT2_01126 [Planctomycetaceae bacterium]